MEHLTCVFHSSSLVAGRLKTDFEIKWKIHVLQWHVLDHSVGQGWIKIVWQDAEKLDQEQA